MIGLLFVDAYHDIEIHHNTPNHVGTGIIVTLLIGINICVLVFTTTLIYFHYKLYKLDLTAYEFLIYKRDRKERLSYLRDGIITQEEFDEEDQRVIHDIRKIKKSKIIHAVKSKNKNRYNGNKNQDLEQSMHDKREELKSEPINSDEIKKTSLYYWVSAKMCKGTIKEVEKSQRNDSTIIHKEKTFLKSTEKPYSNLHESFAKRSDFSVLHSTPPDLKQCNSSKLQRIM